VEHYITLCVQPSAHLHVGSVGCPVTLWNIVRHCAVAWPTRLSGRGGESRGRRTCAPGLKCHLYGVTRSEMCVRESRSDGKTSSKKLSALATLGTYQWLHLQRLLVLPSESETHSIQLYCNAISTSRDGTRELHK
jgi:hypothetical protein